MSEPNPLEPQRLSKRVAAQLRCSRGDAELAILGGCVRVDGERVEQPQARVRPDQRVEVDAQARRVSLEPVTLLWHKPAGLALPEESPLPDELALQWLPDDQRHAGGHLGLRTLRVHRHRLLMLSPLDGMASGLMVFTQQPGVARRLQDRQVPVEHEWLVDVASAPPANAEARGEMLRSIGKPLYFDGDPLPAAKASWQSERRLRLVVKGPLPGQVSHLCERAGLGVAALRRQRIGRIGLDGMAPGQWRYLATHERF